MVDLCLFWPLDLLTTSIQLTSKIIFFPLVDLCEIYSYRQRDRTFIWVFFFCFVTSYFNLTFFISSVKRFRLIVQTILISNIFTHLDKLVDNNGGRLQRIHYFLNIIYFSYLSLNPNSKLHSVYQRTHLLNHLIAFRRLCPKQQFRTTKFLVKIHRTMVRERKFNK